MRPTMIPDRNVQRRLLKSLVDIEREDLEHTKWKIFIHRSVAYRRA